MKTCPYCAAGNRDDAAQCVYCGTALRPWPDPIEQEEAARTQPLHPRPIGTGGAARGPGSTQPAAPYSGQPPYQPGYGPGSAPPRQTYPPPAYDQYPSYRQPVPPPQSSGGLWRILLVGLGLVMLAACSLAVLTLYSAANRGRASAGVPWLPQATQTVPAPTVAPEPTLAPEDPVQPVPDSPATPVIERLLSPECAAAVDSMQAAGKELADHPTAPLRAEWRENFGRSVDALKAHCGTLDSASPVPGQLAEAQRNLDQATSEFDQANQLFKEGVENWQPGKLLEAGRLVTQALEHLGLAVDALRQIGN